MIWKCIVHYKWYIFMIVTVCAPSLLKYTGLYFTLRTFRCWNLVPQIHFRKHQFHQIWSTLNKGMVTYLKHFFSSLECSYLKVRLLGGLDRAGGRVLADQAHGAGLGQRGDGEQHLVRGEGLEGQCCNCFKLLLTLEIIIIILTSGSFLAVLLAHLAR